MPHPRRRPALLLPSLACLSLAAACAHDDRAGAPASTAAAATSSSPRPNDYVCTQVMGVSVTGDWFNAGFESALDSSRWQVVWRKKAFVDLWSDPASELWSLPPQSPCAVGSDSPDRVIFTGVNWTFTSFEQWDTHLERVVTNLRARYPKLRRIELLTMLRGPGNRTCGSPMTVVEPHIDQAVAAVVARHPGLVFAAPKVEAQTCDVFIKGGPHYTDAGMAAVARLYASHLPPIEASCACKAGR